MTAKVSNVPGQANPTNIPQFNWRQLAAFLLLPVAWWFILLYGITPLLLPACSAPNGEPNGWVLLSIQALGYLFEFFLALNIFRKEGYALRLRALKERIHWRWPRGWKAWGIILVLFVVGFGISQLLQPLSTAIASVLPPPDWFPASQHPLKEVNSVQDAYPGVVLKGNYLFLLLALFTGTMNIVGEDLYYRGALIPKLHGLFGKKWAWLAAGIIWMLKHIYVWWRFIGDAGALGIAGAYIFGPLGSLPVTMLVHFIPNYGMTWPLIIQAVFGIG
jgi:hypothetical protein